MQSIQDKKAPSIGGFTMLFIMILCGIGASIIMTLGIIYSFGYMKLPF